MQGRGYGALPWCDLYLEREAVDVKQHAAGRISDAEGVKGE